MAEADVEVDVDEAVARRALADAGVDSGGPLTLRWGWSNLAWIGEEHVVRVSSGRLRGSFEHEHRVVDVVARGGVPCARAVASGHLDDGRREWIVSERLQGRTLAEAWPDLDAAGRRRVGVGLGRAMRALHEVPGGADVEPPAWWVEAHERSHFHNAYKPHVSLSSQLAAAARELPDADASVLDALDAFLAERLPLFAGDDEDDGPRVLTHADVHGHNVFVTDGDDAVHLLDWEGAHAADPDLELDMLLRWTAAAHAFPEKPNGVVRIEPGDALGLVDHVAEGYPEVFAGPSLRTRLEVYAANWHLVQVLFDRHWRDTHPETEDAPPSRDWADLRALVVDGRCEHLDAFGPVLGR